MKPAVIYSIPAPTSLGFSWRWRSVDGKTESARQFPYYYDCLADAKTNGYAVEVTVAHGSSSPGWGSLTESGTPPGS